MSGQKCIFMSGFCKSDHIAITYVVCLYVIYPHRTHMQDLKDITQDVHLLHYENFHKKKLLQGGGR